MFKPIPFHCKWIRQQSLCISVQDLSTVAAATQNQQQFVCKTITATGKQQVQ